MTNATNLFLYNLQSGVDIVRPANANCYSTLGIGSSSNVYVTDSVYPWQSGISNNPTISKGQLITTFNYDLTKSYDQAPSFDSGAGGIISSILSPLKDTIDIPTDWSIQTTGNTITSIQPSANVTISCRQPTPGTARGPYRSSDRSRGFACRR